MLMHNLALTLIIAFTWHVNAELNSVSPTTAHSNSTVSILREDDGLTGHSNATDAAVGSRISTLTTYLPTLKNGIILICVLTVALIVCLVIKVVRSGRRIRKTRKYDIITTPAERVEMAPLNEDNEDEDDSTLFDVKYR